MDRVKRKRLEKGGWRVGTASDLIGMTDAEAHVVEMKLALCNRLRRVREVRGWTQTELAKRMGSSQSRVAKMEAGDVSVTIDLLIHALLAVGASPRDIAKTMAPPPRKAAGA